MSTSPIADLSYRNYDGPLAPPLSKWWAISRVGILRAFKNKWFWVFSILSGVWYLILMIVFYFVDQFASSMIPRAQQAMISTPEQASDILFKQVRWGEQFLHAFSMGQLFFFILALLLGVGAIANDNRANALLVYLSKPCTKLDYIVGKWMGIFIPMCVAVAIPTFFFYGYCFMSYREQGFLSQDPFLILKLVILVIVPAAFHASVALGVSSMFQQGRLAGATYAALYFISLFFTKAMGFIHVITSHRGGEAPAIVNSLFYFSIDGIQIGLAKALLGTDGGNIFPFRGPGTGIPREFIVPAPNGLLMAVVFLLFAGISVLFAWSRVRAVEVVG